MNIESLGSLVRNRHFLRFVALLRISQSAGWRVNHPEMPPIRTTLDLLMKMSKSLPDSRDQLIEHFTSMLTRIVTQDSALHYAPDDLDWFFAALDSEDAQLIVSMLLAYASCPERWHLAEELASMTPYKASTWRKYAAEGRILGAEKRGETWILPESGLAHFGVELAAPMTFEVETL